jgi:hypothetical protein
MTNDEFANMKALFLETLSKNWENKVSEELSINRILYGRIGIETEEAIK